MKQSIGIIAAILLLSSLVGACSSKKSYAQMLKEEKDAIEAFIEKNGLKIVEEFPKDTIFEPNEYYMFENGLYMNIIYRGNMDSRPKPDTTNIFIRFRNYFNLLNADDSTYIDGNWFSREPIEFVYGYSDRAGWQDPLRYLGDSAQVKLIIPSKLGNTDEQGSVIPYYYGLFRYIFEK